MHVMLLALVLLGFNCFHIHVSTLCVVSLDPIVGDLVSITKRAFVDLFLLKAI